MSGWKKWELGISAKDDGIIIKTAMVNQQKRRFITGDVQEKMRYRAT